MGVRSDVGIAMKEYVYENLSVKAKEFLEEWGFEESARRKPEEVNDEDDAGRLLTTSDVKWYSHDYDDIIAFMKHLNEHHDEDDWLLLQACHDYPEANDGDEGGWYNNPFDFVKNVSVELAWY
tara:strand:+ start:164 stop:532 length:369 start_codon:yes stop_codon:yes gene_type:complete